MVDYKCFNCGKKIKEKELKKRFECPNCGKKIFFKTRDKIKKVKAV